MSNSDSITAQPLSTGKHFTDLTGQQFHYLTVTSYIGIRRAKAWWLCLCKCGRTKEVPTCHLKNGQVKSCGCYRREFISRIAKTHGLRDTPEYNSFASARGRCTNPQDAAYADYGGRGIEFRFNSFEEFLQEIGPRPDATDTLDRINVNGHYEHGNVRWATRSQQSRNRRDRLPIIAFGKSLLACEWAELTNIPMHIIWQRVAKYGWCADCSVSQPVGKGGGVSPCLHRH